MDERNHGFVSLWLGRASSRTAFEAATRTAFSPDGDFLGSPFSRAFGIGYFEDALSEADFRETACPDLASLLRGCSHADRVIPRFER